MGIKEKYKNVALGLTTEMTKADLKSTFLLLAEAGLLSERGFLTREESDELVRVFIQKIVSHVTSPYCDIDNESGETYYLFRIGHGNEPFAVIDEQNKTYYTFRPVPYN